MVRVTKEENIGGEASSIENESDGSAEFSMAECLARIVSNMQRMQPDYAFIASELAHVLPFDVLGVVLLRHDRQAIRVTTCQRDRLSQDTSSIVGSSRWLVRYHQHPYVDSMLEKLVEHPDLYVNEYAEMLDGLPAQCGDALSGHHQLRTTCVVPLQAEERIFGTLELGSGIPGIYSRRETTRLVSAIAQVLATAIERAQLGGNTQIQDRQRQALKEVSTALASKSDVAVVLEHITAGISKALNVSSLLLTLDHQDQQLQLAAHAAISDAQLSSFVHEAHIFEEDGIIGRVILSRQPLLSDDIETDERFPASRYLYTRLHMHSVLCYPLIADNVIYGVLLLCKPDAGGFTPLKVDIVALFANQAAIALREGVLLESGRQRRHFQEAIEQLEREVQLPLSDEEELRLFTQVRTEVRRTFGISLSSVLKLVGNNLLTKGERAARIPAERERETVEQVETVLVRAEILSELSRLLVQHEQATYGMRDAWFVSNLEGTCVYLNPFAESLCNIQLTDIEQSEISLETLFTSLLGRVQRAEELRRYLREFVRETLYNATLCCAVSREPLSLRLTFEQREVESAGTLTKVHNDATIEKHYQFTRHPMYNQYGQLMAYALQVRDITMRVLEESNKAALLSSVSHHLRTPLTTIKAAVTGLLQDDVPWSEQMRREMLEDINVEADHLTVLVNALIEMSRIEMGALLLDKTWCNLEEIVYSAIDNVRPALIGHLVHVELQNPSLLVYVDYVQIERVLRNLLESAAHYSIGQHTITVRESIDEKVDQPTHLHIRVIYRGEPVPLRKRERFFRSFDNSRRSGNGLSLAICKGIIEAHQGSIWIEDILNGDACFAFTLPIYLSSSAQ